MSDPFKIKIDKDEELPVVAGKVFGAEADEITIIVPKFSKLIKNDDSFDFLKKGLPENKVLLVESVDEKVIKLAKKADLDAFNPFFSKPTEELETEDLEEDKNMESEDTEEKIDEEKEEGVEKEKDDDHLKRADIEIQRAFSNNQKTRKRLRLAKGPFLGMVTLLLLIGIGVWTSINILPKAEIQITTKKTHWPFSGEVVIDKNAVASDIANLTVPGQIFSQTGNVELSFPASDKKEVSQRAKGKIVIYNAFGSQPQPLVATTRFETPDGKIFRLDEAVTVPGAKITDGKIVPAAIEAAVTADKPGESFNVGPIAKLTIPGFKRIPQKYAGFYGEIKMAFSGGYVGIKPYPTDEDLKLARQKSEATLKESLAMTLKSQIPDDFDLVKDAEKFVVINERVNPEVNDRGEFSLFTEGRLSLVGFRERDLLSSLDHQLKKDKGEDFTIKTYELSYQLADADFANNKVRLAINFNAVAEKPLDIEEIQQKIAGKSKEELKALIYGLPGLSGAEISLWPFWVGKAPSERNKIEINVD